MWGQGAGSGAMSPAWKCLGGVLERGLDAAETLAPSGRQSPPVCLS